MVYLFVNILSNENCVAVWYSGAWPPGFGTRSWYGGWNEKYSVSVEMSQSLHLTVVAALMSAALHPRVTVYINISIHRHSWPNWWSIAQTLISQWYCRICWLIFYIILLTLCFNYNRIMLKHKINWFSIKRRCFDNTFYLMLFYLSITIILNIKNLLFLYVSFITKVMQI